MDSHSLPYTLSSSARTTLEQTLVSTVNTTHSGCRILRSGGPNHSKSLCAFRVHTPLDRAFLGCPQAHPALRIRRVQSATRLEKSSAGMPSQCVIGAFLCLYKGTRNIGMLRPRLQVMCVYGCGLWGLICCSTERAGHDMMVGVRAVSRLP